MALVATGSHLVIMKGNVPEDKALLEDRDGRPGSLVTSLSSDATMSKVTPRLDLQLWETCSYWEGSGTQTLGIMP